LPLQQPDFTVVARGIPLPIDRLSFDSFPGQSRRLDTPNIREGTAQLSGLVLNRQLRPFQDH